MITDLIYWGVILAALYAIFMFGVLYSIRNILIDIRCYMRKFEEKQKNIQ